MKELTEAQQKVIERCRKAITAHHQLAADADKAGLPILARDNDYYAEQMEKSITMQLRAFRDGSLSHERA